MMGRTKTGHEPGAALGTVLNHVLLLMLFVGLVDHFNRLAGVVWAGFSGVAPMGVAGWFYRPSRILL